MLMSKLIGVFPNPFADQKLGVDEPDPHAVDPDKTPQQNAVSTGRWALTRYSALIANSLIGTHTLELSINSCFWYISLM